LIFSSAKLIFSSGKGLVRGYNLLIYTPQSSYLHPQEFSPCQFYNQLQTLKPAYDSLPISNFHTHSHRFPQETEG